MNQSLVAIPLGEVSLQDEYCLNAMKKEAEYLRSLQLGRLLAGFYENAGLKTPFVRYGGWESGLMGGHTLGHFLSAIAHGAVNGGMEEDDRAFFAATAKRAVDSLKECQTALGSGLIWGAPKIEGGVEAQFDHVERGKTNIVREAWVPWYTLHKLLAGLVDVFRFLGYPPALEVASKLGDWVSRRVSRWTPRLQKKVLSIEYGGMNDALYDLFALTKKEEHSRAAHAFDEEELFDLILSEKKDGLDGKHANMTIPKVIGALRRYTIMREERYLNVAKAFFRTVVERHTYVTGGNSEWEHFGKDGILDAERTNCNCETCNVYNMLKLARGLFCVTGEKRYTDYYDTAFTNSVLASQNPETGMTTYFQPMASGFFKVFSTPEHSFWCCTGSGMENFCKLGDSAFYRNGKAILIEQYLSAKVDTEGVSFELKANFPLEDRAVLRVTKAAEPFPVSFRIPDWAAGEITLEKNGSKARAFEGNGHLTIVMGEGDEIVLRIPVGVSLKGLPDGKNAFAFLYGGAVLSADLGTEEMETVVTGVDVLIPEKRKLKSERVYFPSLFALFDEPSKFLVREGDEFLLKGDVTLRMGLHYRRYRERYAIYLRLMEGPREAEEETRTPVDAVQPGYGQYESDSLHEMQEENSVSLEGVRYARAGGYFSYDFKVDPARDNVLSIRLRRADNGKPLRISVGDKTIVQERLCYTLGEDEYRREIPLPRELLNACLVQKPSAGNQPTVRIRFEGSKRGASPRLLDMIYIY